MSAAKALGQVADQYDVSEMLKWPSGFKTRNISLKTPSLFGIRFLTFELILMVSKIR